MKKKRLFIIPAGLVFIVLAGFIWWRMPVTFLANVSAGEVASIEVMDGNSGRQFAITEVEDISYIVANIQQNTMKKWQPSLGYMGYSYQMTFLNAAGHKIAKFVLNSNDTIRKDPFFYCNKTAGLCYDYLGELENQYSK